MFTTDTQTVTDLGIFGKSEKSSIYSLYNRTRTKGGAVTLEELFRYPLSDAGNINKRSSIIAYFAEQKFSFPFELELLDGVEQYLIERDERTRLSITQQNLKQKINSLVANDAVYKNIVRGVTALITLLQELRNFMHLEVIQNCIPYTAERNAVLQQLSEADFLPILETNKNKLPQEKLSVYDGILRFRRYTEVRKLLQYIYNLDVYISVGDAGTECGFAFASAIAGDEAMLNMADVKHPGIAQAKGNDIKIDSDKNVVFLTGANMAGKSTLMKSVGIALYVAHMGFPVAVKRMQFSVLNGLFSTINLPDNLGMGASHFYAEVLRVKKVAQALSEGKRLFVLFDELFRGTNVRDANEATVAIVKGFTRKKNSLFIISTHIIEAGDILKEKNSHIQYRFMPTKMQGHTPVYTYLMEEGITADRHGMLIINNEGILEMLNNNIVIRDNT